ncbi:YhcH/YjgK/YiaL family protein [Lewinella sp. 4G2]|uniref:YhcH/YjgK/YiaL family protein n=1 Tax=Lewinella sp. 4G2 TaxID=1803372 RepID=UPI0007B46A94|nr:YhcH/YjgK/YiaL family protein [Lewinella sp. 4G2]OAV44299.1 hypothetical protein A3850_007240 [Lewinella sp. 4G2]
MIIDKVENLDRYALSEDLRAAIKENAKTDTEHFERGKFDIASDDSLFGIRLEYDTKDEGECLWEAHRKYVDVHLILEGEEMVFVNDIQSMKSSKPYVNADDYELFVGEAKDEVVLRKGMFLVLYPNEVHKTSVHHAKPNQVSKVVLKMLALR